jgi:hypothetical protein
MRSWECHLLERRLRITQKPAPWSYLFPFARSSLGSSVLCSISQQYRNRASAMLERKYSDVCPRAATQCAQVKKRFVGICFCHNAAANRWFHLDFEIEYSQTHHSSAGPRSSHFGFPRLRVDSLLMTEKNLSFLARAQLKTIVVCISFVAVGDSRSYHI